MRVWHCSYYRIYVLKELAVLKDDKKRNNVKGYDWKSFGLLFQHYWHRLFGTCALWFLNDVYFYGAPFSHAVQLSHSYCQVQLLPCRQLDAPACISCGVLISCWAAAGNGVFRSTFVGILVGPQASILTNWLWSFLNAGIQLFGYYAAALTVDIKPWGRRRMTIFSFFMVSSLIWEWLCSPVPSLQWCVG